MQTISSAELSNVNVLIVVGRESSYEDYEFPKKEEDCIKVENSVFEARVILCIYTDEENGSNSNVEGQYRAVTYVRHCLLYTSPSPRD